GDTTARRTADLNGFEAASRLHASSDFVDNFTEGGTHGYLDQPAALDSTSQGKHFCAFAFVCAVLGKRLGPVSEDPGYHRQCFHVIDHRRLSPESILRWERRTQAGHPTLPLNRGNQRGFLATNKSTGAFLNAQTQRIIGA